ncbi:MAG: SusC/RagA family TonB-linked outer membrane protein [Bacteroidales bacterium]|nr:SusC/RagA family TonB-linked outer membrane protein [Bacteroidales bacterium]
MKKKSHLVWKLPQKFRKTITRVILLLVCLVPLESMAQGLTIQIEKGTLDKAFQQIMKHSDIQLVYNTEAASKISCAAVSFENEEITRILTALLAKTELTWYRGENNIYIISDKRARQSQQLGKISGRVEDENGEPLVGVTVVIKGTYTGAATDVDGNFSINGVRDSSVVLVVTFVGKESKEVTARLNARVVITLKDDASEIEEVVVTGYQSISKEKVTGSTSTVTSRQLEERYTPNILNNLEGRVAGLVTYGDKTLIRGSSSMYAETSPLLVVDGLPIEGKIEDLNPYDIESVTVLKDAAATAIYGARASNGVIVITTKKANKMGVTEINFSGNLTVYEKRNLDYADNFYMTPAQQVDKESEYYHYYFFENTEDDDPIGSFEDILSSYGAITPLYYAYYQYAKGLIDEDKLETIKNDLKKNNFAKEFGKHALRRQFLQQYNLAIRNRSEKFNSSLVFNLRRDNNGIINSYDNQINISYRGSYDMNKWLTVNFGFNGIVSKAKESASAYATDPFNVPAYYRLLNDDGSYHYYSPSNFNQYYTLDDENSALRSMDFNHLEELNYDKLITDRRNMRYQGELLFKVIDGLTVNTQFIYETERQNVSNYSEADSYVMRLMRNVYTLQKGSEGAYTYEYMIPENGGKLTTEDTRGDYWTVRGQLNFRRTFAGKHTIDFLGGFEFRETKLRGTKGILLGYDELLQSQSTTGVSFPDLYDYKNTTFFVPGYYAEQYVYSEYIEPYIGLVPEEYHRYASGYMNLTYTYDNRYNVFASFRKDYADLFGANAKFRGKPLWSVGASWNLYNESFLSDVAWLNSLKLRVSYGVTGNIYQDATSYMTASTGDVNRYTSQPQAAISSPANPNLKWEKTATTNVGVDFSFFEHRLRGSLDWYHKKGTDIFSLKSLDVSKGFTSMNMNMADMKNNGIEVMLSYDWFRVAEQGRLSWTTSLTAAYNKNKITSMEIQATSAHELVSSGFKTGYPTSALFSYRYAGLDDSGQPLWTTADGREIGLPIQNESINSLVYSGQSDPKVNMAMDNNIRYKGFSLNFMMVYYGGHKMRVRQYNQLFTLPFGAAADYYVNSWTPENTSTDVPGIGQYGAKSTQPGVNNNGDIFVQPADFIKIRTITLGYDVPHTMLRQVGLNNLQVRFQIDNLPAIWKKNDVKVDAETLGIRKQMSYILGLNFSF